ncbi:MAG: DUF4142 domain-containing protein [Chitinophagaceae bacterium]|nr:DUF4142 domain-containing protein [Chitinophagaceae bacterium]
MKKVSIVFLFFAGTTVFQACNDSSTTQDTATTSTDSTKMAPATTDTGMANNNMASTAPVSKESSEFVMKAASGGMMEVELGQMAQQKAKSQRVKDFASMLVTDHTNANNELKSLATANNVSVPTTMMTDHQKHVDMMKNKTGTDFDKAYISMMVADHKEDIEQYKKEANATSNDAFKGFAAKALPVLQKHMDSAQAIHNGKM